MEKRGKAATRAKNKYNAAHYDRLYPVVPKGRKAVYEAVAKAAGMSLNEYIIAAIEEKMERDAMGHERVTQSKEKPGFRVKDVAGESAENRAFPHSDFQA